MTARCLLQIREWDSQEQESQCSSFDSFCGWHSRSNGVGFGSKEPWESLTFAHGPYSDASAAGTVETLVTEGVPETEGEDRPRDPQKQLDPELGFRSTSGSQERDDSRREGQEGGGFDERDRSQDHLRNEGPSGSGSMV